MRCTELDAARLRTLLRYDCETGHFFWLPDCLTGGRHRAVDVPVGACSGGGYVRICIDRVPYLAHRLAWLHVHGVWPLKQVDHVNGDKSDNRISNLRLATRFQNQRNRGVNRNNKTGLKGVHQDQYGNFRAKIHEAGKSVDLGAFATADEAHAAYCRRAAKVHGKFACFKREVELA